MRYGFDFDREDDDWNVGKLDIPSAFVGVGGDDADPEFLRRLNGDWIIVPNYMEWKDGLYVKQMHKNFLVNQDSFGEAYLDFFQYDNSRVLKNVAPQGWFVN